MGSETVAVSGHEQFAHLRSYSISCGLFVSAPALGAAECRPAAVYSLSPACIRHPSCPGTDPDTCHQCSTGMCPRDAELGFELGTSRSWLLAAKECSAHSSFAPLSFSKSHLYTLHIYSASQRTRWGFLMYCIQSASLTIKFLSDKEMHGREVSRILEESLMYMYACLTRGNILTNCLIVRLSFHL